MTRREASCECCHRNDAPEGEQLCVHCARHASAAEADRDRLKASKIELEHQYHLLFGDCERYRTALEQITTKAVNFKEALAIARAALADTPDTPGGDRWVDDPGGETRRWVPADTPDTPPYCTCPTGADGNPCVRCGKPEATTRAFPPDTPPNA